MLLVVEDFSTPLAMERTNGLCLRNQNSFWYPKKPDSENNSVSAIVLSHELPAMMLFGSPTAAILLHFEATNATAGTAHMLVLEVPKVTTFRCR